MFKNHNWKEKNTQLNPILATELLCGEWISNVKCNLYIRMFQ